VVPASQRAAITAAYEVLRAFAIGVQQDIHPPAGFGVLLRSGLPAWLAMWVDPPPPAVAEPVPAINLPTAVFALRPELVLVLATMALGHRLEARP
jgi:hypothetical protein